MTHKDIYTKFMIEYDKANVTSSYPSLTEYEVATVLDKAYNAIIAQKVTGNNVRRVPFEYDTKSISDLQPLITSKSRSLTTSFANVKYAELPSDFLYFVSSKLPMRWGSGNTIRGEIVNRLDDQNEKEGASTYVNAALVNHKLAEKFIATANNIPWIKNPVCYIENDNIFYVLDPLMTGTPKESSEYGNRYGSSAVITYIKQPATFVKNLDNYKAPVTYFTGDAGNVDFELNSTMAEELISLAVSFALENVESQRLNTKLNMRGLES